MRGVRRRWRQIYAIGDENEEFGREGEEGEDKKSYVRVKDEKEEFWVSRRGRERFVGLKLTSCEEKIKTR